MTINNLPADEKQGINSDLQNLNYNIAVREKNLKQFIDSSALDIFIDFFSKRRQISKHTRSYNTFKTRNTKFFKNQKYTFHRWFI